MTSRWKVVDRMTQLVTLSNQYRTNLVFQSNNRILLLLGGHCGAKFGHALSSISATCASAPCRCATWFNPSHGCLAAYQVYARGAQPSSIREGTSRSK